MSGYYDTAQVCLNGHIINDSYTQYPEFNQSFCGQCGAETITTCIECGAYIKGSYIDTDFCTPDMAPAVSSYCHNCGKPYPWTLSALEAAQELLEIEDILSQEELDYLSKNMSAIVSDTPKTTVVATKLKLAVGKLSRHVGSAIYDIVVDVASETAKKTLFPHLP